MKFNFVRFTDTSSSFAARITIRQTGQFGFNSGAINRFKLQDFNYSVLYFDPDGRVVGIELTNENGEGAIEIKKSEANTFLRSKNFCDRFGIDYIRSRRYELKKDETSGFLYFELDKELESKDTDEAEKDCTD